MLALCLWIHLLLAASQCEDATCATNNARNYVKLYNGNLVINSAYTSYGTISKIRCASLCNVRAGCWLFTWDREVKNCSLLINLSNLITTMIAPFALQTYFVSNINGKEIFMTTTSGTFLQMKTTCESMGGALYLPEVNTFLFIYHHAFGPLAFWVGMYRNPANTTVWYNMDGETVFPRPQWYPTQPNNVGGVQYFVSSENGYLYDVSNANILPGLCAV